MLACGDFSGAYYKPSEIRLEKEISSFELNRLFRHGPVITEALSNFSARKISAETAGEEAGFIYYEATDEEDELNFISFEIKHLISQGLAPPKIGVIYKDLEFPGNFRQTASTFGLSVLDYPGTGVIVPFIPRVVKILQDNETVDTMSVLEKNLSPDEFRRTRRWFELRMKKFAPYVTGTDRNRRLVENLKGIGAREEDSVKLVVEHFAESYQFDVVFIPSFDGWNFPESLRGTVNAMISRASKGVFLTRPLKRPPKFKWQKPFLTSPSPLIRFFPVKTLKGSGSGTLKKILSKIF